MLSNIQSLFLCGLLAGAIFIAGILKILDNYIVKTILTIIFIIIVSNLIYVNTKSIKEEEKDLN